MHIEALTEDDWQRAKAIRLRALADTPDAFGSTLAEERDQPEAFWRARLAATDRVTYVADLGGQDVGLAVCAPFDGLERTAGLFSMWTAPDARGKGIGTALVHAVIGWARDRAFERLALDVADTNEPAIALYAKCGFVPTGEVSTLPPPRTHITEHRRLLKLTEDRAHSG